MLFLDCMNVCGNSVGFFRYWCTSYYICSFCSFSGHKLEEHLEATVIHFF